MKRVAIVTLLDNMNYGNRLQNYAMQKVLENLEMNCWTLFHAEYRGSIIHVVSCMFERVRNIVKTKTPRQIISKTAQRLFNSRNREQTSDEKQTIRLDTLRKQAFSRFNEEYLNVDSKHIGKYRIAKNLQMSYDLFCLGSDQVWNPSFGLKSPLRFLSFAQKGQRFSYAASFGVSSIPKGLLSRYRRGLEGMSSVLVREEAGAHIVRSLTSMHAHVVLDPTMLLTKYDWLKIARKSECLPRKRYVLTFFLGEVSQSREKYISEIATKYELLLVRLNDTSDPDRYIIPPDEFLSYLNEASLILTDSFHVTALSIVLERPFLVFERLEQGESMFSRIETLLNVFQLQSRFCREVERDIDLLQIDYTWAEVVLEKERARSEEIFAKSLQDY